MNTDFKPVSPERAEQIRRALEHARSNRDGIAIDRESGQLSGAAPLNTANADKVNMIGKFDTHYQASEGFAGRN